MGGRIPGMRGTPSHPPQYDPPRLEPFEDVPSSQVTERVTNRIEEREITLDGAEGKRYIAYGRQKFAGKRQYWFVPPLAPNDVWIVKELCAGECDGIIGVEIIPGFTEEIGAHAVGNPSLEIFWHPGTPAGEVDTHLAAVDPSWNELFPGTCYVVEHYKGLGNYWLEIPNTVYEMRTRKCLDPSNPTGPRVYSENAWDQWFDYVVWEEGKGLPLSRVNATSFANAKAADIAASRSMDCHPLLMDKTSPDDVVKMFRIMTSAFWFPDGNQWMVVPDRAGAAVVTYHDVDVESSQPISGSREDGLDRPNKVIGYYTEITGSAPMQKWQKSEPLIVQTDAVANGLEDPIEVEYDLQWTHDAAVCRSRLVYILNSFQFDAKLKERWRVTTAERKLGDIITRDIPERGLLFTGRLMRRVKNIENTFDVVLSEYNIARYSYDPVSVSPKTPSTFPVYDPNAPEPPNIIVDTVDGDGNHLLSWTKPPVRSAQVFGAGSWSQLGLSDFTAASIQDGNKITHAARFNATTNPAYMQLDAGTAIAIREVILRIDAADAYGKNQSGGAHLNCGQTSVRPVLSLYFADSAGGPWTLATSASPKSLPSMGPNTFWYPWLYPAAYFAVAASVGAHRYWRIQKDAATAHAAWINEVELFTYSGATYPYVRGYRLRGWKPNPQTSGVENFSYPDALKIVDVFLDPALYPIRREEFLETYLTTTKNALNGSILLSFGSSYMVEVATISSTNVISEFRALYVSESFGTQVSQTADPDGVAQTYLPLARQDLTLANSGNNDVNISRIVDVLRIVGPTADFTVTGFNHGYEGRIVILKNATSFKMTLADSSASSAAANRFSFGRDVIVPAGGTIVIFYNGQSSLWERNESRLSSIFDDGAGRVGIGVAPTSRLEVLGGSGSNVKAGAWESSSAYTALSLNGNMALWANFYSAPSAELVINRPTGQAISFRENNTEQFLLLTGGALSALSGSTLRIYNADNTNYAAIASLGTPPNAGVSILMGSGVGIKIENGGNACVGNSAPNTTQRLQVIHGDAGTAPLGTSKAAVRIINSTAVAGNEKAEVHFGTIDVDHVYAAISGLLTDGSSNTRGDLVVSTRNAPTDANLTERMRIDGSGNVTIGGSRQGGSRLESQVAGNNSLALVDTTAFAAGVGGGVQFLGTYTATPSYATFAMINGRKENATSGDYAGEMRLQTRVNGGALIDAVVISSGQNVGIGKTPSARLDVNGAGIFDNDSNNNVRVGTATAVAAAAVSYRLWAGSTKYGWAIGAQNFVHDTLEFMPTTAAGGTALASPVMVLSQSGNLRIGATAPATRLHVGAGGTGTQAEFATIDAGSGSGGHVGLKLSRGGALKAQFGVPGTNGGFISDSAVDDTCLSSVTSINSLRLSGDGGSTTGFRLDSSNRAFLPQLALTSGTLNYTYQALASRVLHRFDWTNAMVTALGAVTSGDITLGTLQAGHVVVRAYIRILTAAGGVTTLTISLGRTAVNYDDYIVASDALAAANTLYGDASGERGANLTGFDVPSLTGTTPLKLHLVSTGGNLSAVTGSTGVVYVETTKLP